MKRRARVLILPLPCPPRYEFEERILKLLDELQAGELLGAGTGYGSGGNYYAVEMECTDEAAAAIESLIAGLAPENTHWIRRGKVVPFSRRG